MDIDTESSDELSNKETDFEFLNEKNQDYFEYDISDSDSEDESIYHIKQNENIYCGSNITIEDFALSFLVLCKKLNISSYSKTILLDFIRTILPVFNKIPSSYSKLIKNLSFTAVKKTRLCKACLQEICSCNNSTKEIEIYEFDVKNQINCIVKKNWNTICSYKGTFQKYRQNFIFNYCKYSLIVAATVKGDQ